MLIPNRDSPNGYSTVMPAELQSVTFVTLSRPHKTLTMHKLACSCFAAIFGYQYDDDHMETQGVDTPAELEPNMIGDGAPPPDTHPGPEQGVLGVEAPNNTTMPPMGPYTTNLTAEPALEVIAEP